MVRICFVNSLRGWGGAEVWMLDTALALAGRGVTAGIIAQPGSELLARARTAGVPTAAIPIRFDGAPWTLALLTGQLRRWRPRAVIANLTKDLKAAAPAARLAGVPCRLATRESDFPLKAKAYYRWYVMRAASGRAGPGGRVAGAPWLDEERVHLLYKGIDLERFHPRPRERRGDTVGFAGQLIERKGLLTLMAAWSLLEAEPGAPARRLLVAGSGPLREQLAAWRAGLGRPEGVELRGQVEDLVPFYHELDALALPSWSEGFGLVAAEAGACAVPVVAARASSLPEIVDDERTGLLVPPGDAAALAAALKRLLGDRDLAVRLGLAARDHVSLRFDRETTLDRLLELTGTGNNETRDSRGRIR